MSVQCPLERVYGCPSFLSLSRKGVRRKYYDRLPGLFRNHSLSGYDVVPGFEWTESCVGPGLHDLQGSSQHGWHGWHGDPNPAANEPRLQLAVPLRRRTATPPFQVRSQFLLWLSVGQTLAWTLVVLQIVQLFIRKVTGG